MNLPPVKRVIWVGSAKRDIKSFPREVQRDIGQSLLTAQSGLKPRAAKPLKGFGGATVMEIVADHQTNTYRAVYTVRFDDAIYVLHAFQKKSKSGRATTKSNLDLIDARLRQAKLLHERR